MNASSVATPAAKRTGPGWFTDRTGARYVRVPRGGEKRKAARISTCTTVAGSTG